VKNVTSTTFIQSHCVMSTGSTIHNRLLIDRSFLVDLALLFVFLKTFHLAKLLDWLRTRGTRFCLLLLPLFVTFHLYFEVGKLIFPLLFAWLYDLFSRCVVTEGTPVSSVQFVLRLSF